MPSALIRLSSANWYSQLLPLDSARIVNDLNDCDDDIYAVNYNILRIENGMGGLLYSN